MIINELAHHGIKGQKWGVRRFQNPDGTYTNLGKERRNETRYSGKITSDIDEIVKKYDLRKDYPNNPYKSELPVISNGYIGSKDLYDELLKSGSIKKIYDAAIKTIDEGGYSSSITAANTALGSIGHTLVANYNLQPGYHRGVTYSMILESALDRAGLDDYYYGRPARELKKNGKTESDKRLAEVPYWDLQAELETKFGSMYFGEGPSPVFKKLTKEYEETHDRARRQMDAIADKYYTRDKNGHIVLDGAYDRYSKDPEYKKAYGEYLDSSDKYLDGLAKGGLKELGYDVTPEAVQYIKDAHVFDWD